MNLQIMKHIIFLISTFFLSMSHGQTFQSDAKLIQLQVADIKPSKEGVEINTSVESSYLTQYHDPKSVEIRAEISEGEINLISEYPKYTKVTYFVVSNNVPVDGKFNFDTPIHFECITESGDSCVISYFLLNDMSIEENQETVNADKVVMLIIQFPTNRYDYLGYLE
jgi:hypothetical protein